MQLISLLLFPFSMIIRSTLSRCTAFATSMLVASKAWAGTTGNGIGNIPDIIGSNADIRTVVINILKAVLNFMALVAVVFIVIAGIRLVISQGEESQKDTAKKTIIFVIIGLVIIVLARAIVQFVSQVLGI